MSEDTFRKVPRTGVVYVVQEASKLGFYRGNPEWCNLGQGQPQTDLIAGGVERIENIPVTDADNEYAPVSGLPELRSAIANYYNETFRQGKASKYTAKNVSVVSGGRLALARLAASLGNINLGHFVPDYTAYEELLSTFNRFNPIPILLEPEKGYACHGVDAKHYNLYSSKDAAVAGAKQRIQERIDKKLEEVEILKKKIKKVK